jgi:hypothetical protein
MIYKFILTNDTRQKELCKHPVRLRAVGVLWVIFCKQKLLKCTWTGC